jgi:branched-chain amino acid transport system ATP-binding protein
MTALLELDRVSRRFGGLLAIHNLSFAMREGEILGLIGPNGAGKSTLFNLINGVFAPNSGRIVFASRDITGERPFMVAAVSLAPIRSCSRSRI